MIAKRLDLVVVAPAHLVSVPSTIDCATAETRAFDLEVAAEKKF
jgi:hypothetical protein